MSSQDKFPFEGILDNEQAYVVAAESLRRSVQGHLAEIAYGGSGVEIAVHRLDERHPNRIFLPTSVGFILVHTQQGKTTERQALHIIAKEKLDDDPIGNQGQLYTHVALFPNNIAKIRHYTETLVGDTSEYLDNVVTGTLFGFGFDEEGIREFRFNPAKLGLIARNNEDDEYFNRTRVDRFYAVEYGKTLMSLVSEDTILYTVPVKS